MARGDIAAFFAAFDPEMEIEEPPCLPFGGVYKGQREAVEFMKKAAPHIAPGKLAVERLVADGDLVVALLTLGLSNGSEASVTEV